MSGTSRLAAGFSPEKGATARRRQEVSRVDRWKKLGLACVRLLAACAISAALGVGAVQTYQWATRSPLFAVRSVHVRGNVHAPADDLIARSGLLVGQNLFHVDLAAAARGVESSPWVIAASVSRQLPASIEIEVREHVPAARVSLGGAYFTDAAGQLFKKVADSDDAAARALPLITGLSRTDWDAHREPTTAQLLSAIQLISEWRAAGLAPDELFEVRVESDGALTAFAHQSAVPSDHPAAGQPVAMISQEVRVGRGPFAANLHRLARVRLELARRGSQASRIDLDNSSRPDEVAAQIVRNDDPSTARPKGQTARGE